MAYVDGTVIAVKTARKEEFIAFSHKMNALFLECGATACVDCWGDDVPAGKRTDFLRAVEAADDETVVFSWITWPDKDTRTAGWDKVMADHRAHAEEMPFDGARMIFGGFEIVSGE